MIVPWSWRNALSCLHSSGFTEAVIAGGALRDLDHGLAVKDVDIFVAWRGERTQAALDAAMGVAGEKFMDPKVCEYLPQLDGVSLVMNYNIEWHRDLDTILRLGGTPPFQVIAMDQPIDNQSVVDRTDFGLCRIAYDGITLYRSPEYLEDQESRTFTLLRCNNREQFRRSFKRFERLTEKYPGYRFASPLWSLGG